MARTLYFIKFNFANHTHFPTKISKLSTRWKLPHRGYVNDRVVVTEAIPNIRCAFGWVIDNKTKCTHYLASYSIRKRVSWSQYRTIVYDSVWSSYILVCHSSLSHHTLEWWAILKCNAKMQCRSDIVSTYLNVVMMCVGAKVSSWLTCGWQGEWFAALSQLLLWMFLCSFSQLPQSQG